MTTLSSVLDRLDRVIEKFEQLYGVPRSTSIESAPLLSPNSTSTTSRQSQTQPHDQLPVLPISPDEHIESQLTIPAFAATEQVSDDDECLDDTSRPKMSVTRSENEPVSKILDEIVLIEDHDILVLNPVTEFSEYPDKEDGDKATLETLVDIGSEDNEDSKGLQPEVSTDFVDPFLSDVNANAIDVKCVETGFVSQYVLDSVINLCTSSVWENVPLKLPCYKTLFSSRNLYWSVPGVLSVLTSLDRQPPVPPDIPRDIVIYNSFCPVIEFAMPPCWVLVEQVVVIKTVVAFGEVDEREMDAKQFEKLAEISHLFMVAYFSSDMFKTVVLQFKWPDFIELLKPKDNVVCMKPLPLPLKLFGSDISSWTHSLVSECIMVLGCLFMYNESVVGELKACNALYGNKLGDINLGPFYCGFEWDAAFLGGPDLLLYLSRNFTLEFNYGSGRGTQIIGDMVHTVFSIYLTLLLTYDETRGHRYFIKCWKLALSSIQRHKSHFGISQGIGVLTVLGNGSAGVQKSVWFAHILFNANVSHVEKNKYIFHRVAKSLGGAALFCKHKFYFDQFGVKPHVDASIFSNASQVFFPHNEFSVYIIGQHCLVERCSAFYGLLLLPIIFSDNFDVGVISVDPGGPKCSDILTTNIQQMSEEAMITEKTLITGIVKLVATMSDTTTWAGPIPFASNCEFSMESSAEFLNLFAELKSKLHIPMVSPKRAKSKTSEITGTKGVTRFGEGCGALLPPTEYLVPSIAWALSTLCNDLIFTVRLIAFDRDTWPESPELIVVKRNLIRLVLVSRKTGNLLVFLNESGTADGVWKLMQCASSHLVNEKHGWIWKSHCYYTRVLHADECEIVFQSSWVTKPDGIYVLFFKGCEHFFKQFDGETPTPALIFSKSHKVVPAYKVVKDTSQFVWME